MDIEQVIEFLAHVPLLQRLPGSSFAKIAEIVQFKHYNRGEFIVRVGDAGDGIYFIWEGVAEVQGSINDSEDFHEDRSEFQLKRHDCFGHGTDTSYHQAAVVALDKVTCLVLPNEYSTLLEPLSIWSATETEENSMIERILQLDPVEVNLFRGFTPPDAPQYAKCYGGQIIAQALAAAAKTVDHFKLVHSLHSYFLLGGDQNMPILYQVRRLRDGNSFATRSVDATQNGKVIFTLTASFQKEENGFEHQDIRMPRVPAPETLLRKEELRDRQLFDPRLPKNYRNKAAGRKYMNMPVDMRFCEPHTYTHQIKTPSSTMFWFKAWGKLSDDPALHRCVVTYISDYISLTVSLNPHRKRGLKPILLSLDHSVWFHRPFRADDWILAVIDGPSASGGRGFSQGRMFNRQGELIVTLIQEGVIRAAKPRPPVAKSSL
ncbi:hypothetical protein MKW98_025351 [Papaver atlanticum]|uniref:acyl-CoA hydrolase n=1 Tax=Papaver atlanticum TaxID=357466 RepID=A0AAD4S240_9MAGN|nr:hypothetical protein MKW98_025351 [Papaver atlanticum]